jgi:hypothetical protein
MPDSKIGVFETDEGQRGILCVEVWDSPLQMNVRN